MDRFRLTFSSTKHLRTAPRTETRKGQLWCQIVDVYDGDTCTIACVIDGEIRRRRCRLAGYDTPELKGSNAKPTEARAARDHFCMLMPKGVFRAHYDGFDKYGRLLLRFRVRQNRWWRCTRTWICDAMIDAGHAVPYDGGTKVKSQTNTSYEKQINSFRIDVTP